MSGPEIRGPKTLCLQKVDNLCKGGSLPPADLSFSIFQTAHEDERTHEVHEVMAFAQGKRTTSNRLIYVTPTLEVIPATI